MFLIFQRTNNNKRNKAKGQAKKTKQNRSARQPATPAAAKAELSILQKIVGGALRTGGAALGGFVGGPAGATFGRNAGGLMSQVIGSGDYKVEENSILANQVPQFRNGGRMVRVSHKDFLGDVTGSTAFAVRNYPLNPGLSTTFPWLSHLAGNFQSYKIKGMLFEFKSTSADALNSVNTALGTVIMATQYNSMLNDFTSKYEMENYEFSTSGKPSENVIHPVECAQGEAPLECLYVRTGSVPVGQDQRFFDFGEFQIATVGMQAASTIGELWVTYDIELYKPRILPGLEPGLYFRSNNGPYSATSLLGTVLTATKGNMGITIVATGAGYDTLLIPASISAGKLLVCVSWQGVATIVGSPTLTLTNCTQVSDWQLGTSNYLYAPVGGANSSKYTAFFAVTINGYSAAGSTIQFTGGTLPATPAYVDVEVVSIPVSDVFV